MPIIRNTYFSSDLEYLAPIQQDKGYGPAWSLEQSVQHQERWVKETNKHLNTRDV